MTNYSLIKAEYDMFYKRTNEIIYKDEDEKYEDGNFKTLLKNDMKYYLPSVVDQYYHRDILTCNAAEATFSYIMRRLSL